jgi:segregation and condensation protein B
VKIAGRAEVPGRPLLYQTTEYFLQHFGLRAVEELPNQAELRRVPLPSPPPPTEPAKSKKGSEPAPAPAVEAEPIRPAVEPSNAAEPATEQSSEIAADQP